MKIYRIDHTAEDRHDEHKMEKHFFAAYTAEELQRLGYWDYAEARQNNLTYPIHPILHRSRWDSPDNLYDAITHILRLASAMLQSPASVAFHHAVMYGTREYLPELSKRHGWPCYRFHRTNEDYLTTWRYFEWNLSKIAPHIRIRWFKQTDPGFTHLKAFAVTRRNLSSRIYLKGPLQTGNGSDIFLNSVYLENLSKGNMPLSQLLRLQLYMALTISHELAHAIGYAVSMET